MSFMLIAIAIDVAALAGGTSAFAQGATADKRVPRLRTRTATIGSCALVVAAVALDQWRGEGSLTDQARSGAARRSMCHGIEEIARVSATERSRGLHRRARLPDARRPHRSLAGPGRLRSRTLPGAAIALKS